MKGAFGAVLYGLGWGYGGVALGPGIASILINPAMVLWALGVFLGVFLSGFLVSVIGEEDLNRPLLNKKEVQQDP